MKQYTLKKIKNNTNEFFYGYAFICNSEYYQDLGGSEMLCQAKGCPNFIELPAYFCQKFGLFFCKECETSKKGKNTCGLQYSEDNHEHKRIIEFRIEENNIDDED